MYCSVRTAMLFSIHKNIIVRVIMLCVKCLAAFAMWRLLKLGRIAFPMKSMVTVVDLLLLASRVVLYLSLPRHAVQSTAQIYPLLLRRSISFRKKASFSSLSTSSA